MDETRPSLRDIIFPSGDVSQIWSSWGQYMPITINNMNSGDPGKEMKIIRDTASYGRQLGRILDALHVLVRHTATDGYTQEEKQSLQDLSALAEDIAAAKSGMKEPTEKNIEDIVSTLRYWKSHSREYFETVKNRLNQELNQG